MTALTAAQLRKWRTHPYAIDVHLAIIKPVVVFRALVNLATATYPTATIPFDNVTVGAYTDIQPEMVVRIGSAAGLQDYGRQVVKQAATATEITCGWTSRGRREGEIDLVDNAVIEVLDMRVVRAKIPRIDAETGSVTKDGNTGFGVYSLPVANIGPDYAQFVDDSDEITVYFDGSTSFATEPGQSLIAYDWTFPGGTPSTYSGVTPGNVVFGPGTRYASLKVTDLNDRQHTAYALIHGATDGGSYDTIKNFAVTERVRRAEGTTLKLKINEEIVATDYPPGTHVLLWCTERYGKKLTLNGAIQSGVATITGLVDTSSLYVGMPITGTGIQAGATIQAIDSATQVTMTHTATATGTNAITFKPDNTSIAGPTGRQHMLFSGFIADESHIMEFRESGLSKGLTITCVDVAGRLNQLVGFSIELRKAESPNTWSELKTLDMSRAIHYILQWHSNALDLADFTFGVGTDYPHPVLGIDGGSLYEMCNSRAEAIGCRFTCDAWGRLGITRDLNITAEADRTSTETIDLLDNDWVSLEWTKTDAPRTHWLRGASMLISTANAVDYTEPLTSFAISPGKSPGQGPTNANTNYQLAKTVAEHREREGHRYAARQNAKYGYWTVVLAHGGEAGIDPANGEWVRLRVSDANKSLRGDSFPTGAKFMVVQVDFEYDHRLGACKQTLLLEREVIGTAADDDPQPPMDEAPLGDWSGGGWVMDQYLPVLDLGLTGGWPAGLDWGAEVSYDPPTYDPEGGGGSGRMYALCWLDSNHTQWRVARITWTGGSTQTHADVSPSSTIRTNVGKPVRLVLDPFNYKKAVILGTEGMCWTDDITATTPIWYHDTTGYAEPLPAGTHTITFEGGTDPDYTIDYGTITTPGYNSTNSLRGTSNGSYLQSQVTIEFPNEKTITAFSIVCRLGTEPIGSQGVWPSFSEYDADDVLIRTRTNPAGHNFDWRNTSIGPVTDTGVKKLVIQFSGVGGVSGAPPWIDNVSWTTTTDDPAVGTGTPFADFQPLFKKSAYAWLSHTDTHVYFNITLDGFQTSKATIVAPYDADMIYGFTSNPHNWRQIYVVAGDPDPAISSGVYESLDGGAGFTKIATVTDRGGPVWWNWSTTTPNQKNTTKANLCFIRGLDGADVEFRRVGAASEVTIVSDADRYPGAPLALGFNSRDLSYGFYVARTGHFYTTEDAGATWTYTATVTGTLARGWWQYPKDRNFAVVFGQEMLSYTIDFGANFVDMWTAFAAWADGQYGSGIIDTVVNVVIDLTQDFKAPVI